MTHIECVGDLQSVEAVFTPDGVSVNRSDHPELYELVKETIACLPIRILELFGMGSDLCFATYRDTTDRSRLTGMVVRSIRSGKTK